jgi:hypothetical protein
MGKLRASRISKSPMWAGVPVGPWPHAVPVHWHWQMCAAARARVRRRGRGSRRCLRQISRRAQRQVWAVASKVAFVSHCQCHRPWPLGLRVALFSLASYGKEVPLTRRRMPPASPTDNCCLQSESLHFGAVFWLSLVAVSGSSGLFSGR